MSQEVQYEDLFCGRQVMLHAVHDIVEHIPHDMEFTVLNIAAFIATEMGGVDFRRVSFALDHMRTLGIIRETSEESALTQNRSFRRDLP